MRDTRAVVRDWLAEVVSAARFQVDQILLSASREWYFSAEGALRHRSGRFFSLVGVRWQSGPGDLHQPLIKQREIGQLGFLMRSTGGATQLLMHAKIEPGNVGVAQLAPSCQATASNVAQVHGGRPAPFASWFTGDCPAPVFATLQSEQGSRFLGKMNRNVLTRCEDAGEIPATHRWMHVDEVLGLLLTDYLVNTDARSVLVSAPWEALVCRSLFARTQTGFGRDLAQSAVAEDEAGLARIVAEIGAMRSRVPSAVETDLRNLPGWSTTAERIQRADGLSFSVRQIRVTALGREVDRWDQPMIYGSGIGGVDLVCARISGVLRFLCVPHIEPGLLNGAELGPSLVIEPIAQQEHRAPWWTGPGKILASVRQSDEGGRFFRNVSEYRLIDCGEVTGPASAGNWLTLWQVRILLGRGGWLTNEARSAFSLLLYWL